MNVALINEKQKIAESLEVSLKLVKSEIEKLKTEKEVLFTARQLQFRRDDAQPLVNKFKSKKYEPFRAQILAEINKKFELIKTRKDKTDKIYKIYVQFFSENESNKLF